MARKPDTPFAVRIALHAPPGAVRPFAPPVKGIVDGVISAFQAREDARSARELLSLLAVHLPAAPSEVEAHLTGTDRAVLGAVPKLLHARGAGIAWAPADDYCLAGELFRDEPSRAGWAIRGTITHIAHQ